MDRKTDGPILVDLDDYDESRAYYDEPHAPAAARELFADYLTKARRSFLNERKLYSYYLQCRTMASLPDVQRILEIGPGGRVTAMLMEHIGYSYETMDTQPLVQPDILSDFTEFDPAGYEDAYDLVAAFQMLEHVPYAHFPILTQKMALMSRRYIFMSLPFYGWTFSLEVILPIPHWLRALLPRRLANFLSRPHGFAINGPYLWARNRKYRRAYAEEFPLAIHHWEIGRGQVTEKRVYGDLQSVGLRVIQSFHSKAHPYHFFILCEKRI